MFLQKTPHKLVFAPKSQKVNICLLESFDEIIDEDDNKRFYVYILSNITHHCCFSSFTLHVLDSSMASKSSDAVSMHK